MTEETPPLVQAIEAHKRGQFAAAEALYEGVLRATPADGNALNFFGMLRAQTGDPKAAEALLQRAVESDPQNPHAWLNYGNVLVMLNKSEDAVTAFTKATELAPNLPMAWFNLGVCLGRVRRPFEGASAFHRALQLEPGYLPAYESLAYLMHRLGNYEEAAQVYREWLEQDPDSPMARHMLAAASGSETVTRASDDYVRALFDDFASTFDENLQSLNYSAPQLIADRLGREALPEASCDMLDAGCGTGWCGPLVRPLARRLVGVDISPRMVDQARVRGGYDELVVEELCQFMRGRPAAFDLVISADTLVYFGALEEPIAAARTCLRPGGRLVFTVERMEEGVAAAGFQLQKHGRYCHAPSYITTLGGASGFTAITLDTCVLRRERGKDVAGLTVLARAA